MNQLAAVTKTSRVPTTIPQAEVPGTSLLCGKAGPLLAVALSGLLSAASEAQITAEGMETHRFDAPGFVPGTVHDQQDWIVDRGEALVVPAMGLGGSGALAVMESPQPTQVRLPARIQFSAADRPYYADAWVRLRACPWMVLDESIDFSSARIGLFRTGLTSGDAEWHFFSGDGSGGGYWVNTGVAVRVEPFTDLMEGWARLTVGIRPAEGCWDLWVDGQLIGASAGLQFPAGPQSGHFVLLGDSMGSFFADDIVLGSTHPLGFDGDGDGMPDPRPGSSGPATGMIPDALAADRDADGIPDVWETAHSLDPDAAADAALDPDGDGFTSLDEYLMGTDPAMHTARVRLANDGAAVFNRFSASAPRRADTPR
jgi:hypothetical protein